MDWAKEMSSERESTFLKTREASTATATRSRARKRYKILTDVCKDRFFWQRLQRGPARPVEAVAWVSEEAGVGRSVLCFWSVLLHHLLTRGVFHLSPLLVLLPKLSFLELSGIEETETTPHLLPSYFLGSIFSHPTE